MIKIDGGKIKSLREQQGLTQLYMATAVGVTTDTISRWENKRYPTIKEENAQKLAEALGVEIADLLLVEDLSENDDANEHERISPGVAASQEQTDGNRLPKKKLGLFIFLGSVVVIGLIGCAILIGRYFLENEQGSELRAERFMPERTLPGSPFPVVIEVFHQDEAAVSIILKEMLPDNFEVIETLPSEGVSRNNGEIKWLKKIETTTRFSYLVKVKNSEYREYSFAGTISTANETTDLAVSGNSTVQIGPYHWADKDGNNRISDQEILTVFDYYSGIDNFTIDIEFIEKMWLGSNYSWDENTQKISISP